MKRVLVTGAAGFIGAHVCRELLQNGWEVHAAVRGSSAPPGTVPHLVPDITDGPALQQAAAGVDAIVHLAGRAHVAPRLAARDADAFLHTNVRGTAVAVDAGARTGAGTFLLLSSVAAATTPAATAAAANGPRTVYGRSKLAAENVAGERALHDGIRLVVLRPPMVYGEGMKGNPLRLFRLIDRGLPVPVATDTRRSMVYAGTLARAVRCALEQEAVRGVVNACDDAPMLEEFVRAIARALGRPERVVALPAAVMRGAARFALAVSRYSPFPLSIDALAHVSETMVLPVAEFLSIVGTPMPRDEALSRTAAWYRAYHGQAVMVPS